MRNQNIDQCWQFQHGLYDEFPDAEKAKSVREVNLPHDYMIESNVSESAASGPASGCYTQGVAYYTKLIDIPQEWSALTKYDEPTYWRRSLIFCGKRMSTCNCL